MRRAWVYASAAVLLPLLAGCSRQTDGTHRAARPTSVAAEDSPVKIGDVVRTVQQHHGRVKLEIDLSGSAITESALLQTPGLDSATALNLTGVALTDNGLAQLVARMPELRRIDLSGTQVTDTGLEHLKRLRKLEHVGYHNGPISRKALLDLIRFLAARAEGGSPASHSP